MDRCGRRGVVRFVRVRGNADWRGPQSAGDGLPLCPATFFAFNNAATDSATTADLQRTEGAVHFRAIYAYSGRDTMVKVFGGPSFFRLERELVNDITYREAFLPHDIVIDEAPIAKYDGTAWGFNVGTDVAYFFTRKVGIGGTLEFSKAKVTLPIALADSFASTTFDYPVGGLQFGGGLRCRF